MGTLSQDIRRANYQYFKEVSTFMKIGIVTLPLHFNYGGILQAFALQKTIEDLGFNAFVITQKPETIKQKLKVFLYKKSKVYDFIKKNLTFLELHEPFCKNELTTNNLKVLVVGSDQVWRPCMGSNRENNVNRYFLKTDPNNCIKKIAYAASFGVNYWDFTESETKTAQRLINEFSFISIRESSGIKLCSKYLNSNNAIHVLDPTMLVQTEIYKKVMAETPFKTHNTRCFLYLLDYNNITNKHIVEALLPKDAELLTAKVERNIIKKYFREKNTVEDWLSAIYHSNIMITDSFHGCVFSILFHKDFYVMSNEVGGNARIQSLLSLFQLNDRLLDSTFIPQEKITIDWNAVDMQLQKLRKASITYLSNALKA